MDQHEIDEIKQAVTEMMLTSIGPMSAMMTSQFSTITQGLIDARAAFLKAGWEDWMAAEVLVAMAGGSTVRNRS